MGYVIVSRDIPNDSHLLQTGLSVSFGYSKCYHAERKYSEDLKSIFWGYKWSSTNFMNTFCNETYNQFVSLQSEL